MKTITKLKRNEIFVFGSNADGNHAGGAAKLAHEKFGAKMGVARGRTGKCYAIDTMSGIDVIKEQIQPFIAVAEVLPLMNFLVTEIGCGIAGYTPAQIAPLFKDAINVKNIILPDSFIEIINKVEIVYGVKAFDKNMKCRGFQYEHGKEYEHDGDVKHCESGFHFCENPLDVFNYYSPSESIFAEVEGSGKISRDTDDTKVAVSKLKIGFEIGLHRLIEKSIKFIFERTTLTKESTNKIEKLQASNSGDSGAAFTIGNYSTAETNAEKSIAVAVGYMNKAKGNIGSWIVLAERKDDDTIVSVKTVIVDGKKIKADTWYILSKGKFVIYK